jgi:hypothetical protein
LQGIRISEEEHIVSLAWIGISKEEHTVSPARYRDKRRKTHSISCKV